MVKHFYCAVDRSAVLKNIISNGDIRLNTQRTAIDIIRELKVE